MEWSDAHLNIFNQQSLYGQNFFKLPNLVLPQLGLDLAWVANSLSSQEILSVLSGIEQSYRDMPPVPAAKIENSQQTNIPIKMFSGTDSWEITDKDRINKDLMFTLIIRHPSFKLKNSGTNININPSIYYHGNRKKNQPKVDNCEYKLNGIIVDANNNEVGVCPSCGKRDKLNLRVRSADIMTEGEYSGSMVVRGSVTCSGDPPNCSKALRIKLSVGELQTVQLFKGKGGSQVVENVICEGETPYFFLLHHRRKHEAEISCKSRKRQSAESSDEESPKFKRHVTSPPPKEMNLLPADLINQCSNFIYGDQCADYYDTQILHNALKILNLISERCYVLIPSICQVKLLELCLSLSGYQDSQWDLEITYRGNEQFYFKKTEFYLEKMTQSLNSIEGMIPGLSTSKDIMNMVWQILCTPENTMSSYCTCDECFGSHLSFIMNAAACRGAKWDSLIKDLIHFKVPQMFWSFSIQENKNRHFNWRIFTSDSPIGRFSRRYYPASLVRDLVIASYSDSDYNSKRPRFEQQMSVIFPAETLSLRQQLTLQLSATVFRIIENSQSLTELIDIPVNLDDYTICT